MEKAVTEKAPPERPAPPRLAPPTPPPLAAPPAPRPEPPSAVDAAAEAAERRWYAALVEQLRARKRYPLPARRLGQEGVVLLAVRVEADGRLEGVEVKRSSGHPLLDREARRLLEEAAELARDQLRPQRASRLEIPIAYRLGE